MKARKVRQSTLHMLSQHVDVEDVYVTKTVEQSDQSLDEIIQKRYPLVLCGGGDGTAMRIIEQMRKKVAALNEKGGDFAVPRFGLLKLGTGNGWAGQLGVPPRVEPIWRLRQLRNDELVFRRFHMIQAEDRLFHFGGFGLDGMILNDYINLKNRFNKGFMWKVANSVLGYLIATFGIAAPRVAIKGGLMDVRVVNNSDEPVYRVTATTEPEALPIKKGETIFAGKTLIVGFGTTENYGFNLKVYPFASKRPGYMQLRLCDESVPRIIAKIGSVWNGTWETPHLYDFLVKDVVVESEVDVPFQLGGDPEGYRKSTRFYVSDFTAEVLDFVAMPVPHPTFG